MEQNQGHLDPTSTLLCGLPLSVANSTWGSRSISKKYKCRWDILGRNCCFDPHVLLPLGRLKVPPDRLTSTQRLFQAVDREKKVYGAGEKGNRMISCLRDKECTPITTNAVRGSLTVNSNRVCVPLPPTTCPQGRVAGHQINGFIRIL